MRYQTTYLLASAAILARSLAAPANAVTPRDGPRSCNQYETLSSGPFTLQTNQWGASTGVGSQCVNIDGVNGNSIAWTTSWSWANNQNNVKAYPNVQAASFASKPLSQYRSIQTTWKWKYTGDGIRANVAYDTFLGTCPTCNQDYEVMFWLCDYGVIYPLSDNGYPPKPAATPKINNVDWNLIVGHNGAMKVYTFVAQYDVPSFQGDLMNFFTYLEKSFGLNSGLYLQKVQAGTEAFNGKNCVLKTSGYTISVD